MVDVPEKSERVDKLKNFQFEIFVKSQEEWERERVGEEGKSRAGSEWRPQQLDQISEMNKTKQSAPPIDRSTHGLPSHPFSGHSPNRSGSV
jgi:hypothetical protein